MLVAQEDALEPGLELELEVLLEVDDTAALDESACSSCAWSVKALARAIALAHSLGVQLHLEPRAPTGVEGRRASGTTTRNLLRERMEQIPALCAMGCRADDELVPMGAGERVLRKRRRHPSLLRLGQHVITLRVCRLGMAGPHA